MTRHEPIAQKILDFSCSTVGAQLVYSAKKSERKNFANGAVIIRVLALLQPQWSLVRTPKSCDSPM